MLKEILVSLIILSSFAGGFAQQAELTGTVSDEKNHPLAGVHIKIDDKLGVVTDENGVYRIETNFGHHKLSFSYIGFDEFSVELAIDTKTVVYNVNLAENAQLVRGVVVSASRHKQNRNEVPISMEVLAPATIERMNPKTMDEALSFVPGINIADGQISIRGGSGYSYGTGSRVMILVDGLPMLSPDAGDAKWNFIPLNNLNQVEVIKGASSSLYGSSALNGAVNIITRQPGPEPETSLNQYTGIYMSPERDELKWWGDELRYFSGTGFSHAQKFGQLDLLTSANHFHNSGYRTHNSEDRFSYNLKLRYRHPKIKGLNFGLNSSVLYQDKTDFFLWQSDSLAYQQNESTLSPSRGHRLIIDPYIIYYGYSGGRHQLKTRFFNLNNDVDGDDKDNSADLYFGEYQFSRKFSNDLQLTTGTSISKTLSRASLFGDHTSANYSVFAQLEKRFFERLSVTAGLRWEHFVLDEESESTDPLFRAGINYRLFDHTFLRTSYGKGHRYPTIAEKFTYTKVGSIQILPNPRIQSETGWSAEFGLRQEFVISKWKAYADLAAFYTEYHNMMEFTFGTFDSITFVQILDELEQIGQPFGFQSQNVSEAQISGLEFTIGADGLIGSFPVMLLAGYTYTNPIDLNTDSIYNSWKSGESNLLKYRFKHSFSMIANISYGKFTLGSSILHNGNIENIDRFFEFSFVLPGLKEYREENNKGFVRTDFSISFEATKHLEFSLQLKNAFNKEYMIRPGYIAAPRNLTFQLNWRL